MNAVDTLFLLSVGYGARWLQEAVATGRVGAFIRRLTHDATADAAALARKHLRER